MSKSRRAIKKAHSTDRILNAIHAAPWLITNAAMGQILEIAARENTLTPEMISEFQSKQYARDSMVKKYDDTCVLDINGPVFRYANLMTMLSGAASTEVISSELGQLKADSSVKRLIMRYDCPGGMASGAAEMSTQLQNFGKPVIAFATGQACSLAYFWGAQSDTFVVAEDSIVGCIGTRSQEPEGQNEKDVVSQHAPSKIMNRAAMQGICNALEDVFHKHAAHGRGVSVEHVRENFGKGGVFIGQAAVDAGLADSIGTLDSILGGNHVATFTARNTGNQSSQHEGTEMAGDNEAGSLSTADQEQAVKDAREAGKKEGTNASTSEAVTAERERVSSIMAAGKGKDPEIVQDYISDGVSADLATKWLSKLPDVSGTTNLDSQMDGSNPDISNGTDTGGENEGENEAKAITNGWATAREEVYGE